MGEAVRLTAHGWIIRPARARTGRRSARVTGFREFTSKAAGVSGAMWRCTSGIAAVTIRSVFIVAWHLARAARARRTDLRRYGQPRDGPDCRWPRRCALEDVRDAVAASQRAGPILLQSCEAASRWRGAWGKSCGSLRRPARKPAPLETRPAVPDRDVVPGVTASHAIEARHLPGRVPSGEARSSPATVSR